MREQKRIVTKAKTNLWKVVRESSAPTYIVRDLMASELGKRITWEEFDWFLTAQGYSTYRDDVWTSLK